jgi:hypothetical protein
MDATESGIVIDDSDEQLEKHLSPIDVTRVEIKNNRFERKELFLRNLPDIHEQ